MNRDLWLKTHPYLQPVSELETLVDATVAELSFPFPPIPIWQDYAPEFLAGMPLLLSSSVAIDLDAVEAGLAEMIRKLASRSLPAILADEARRLHTYLNNVGSGSTSSWLSKRNPIECDQPGLLHYLGWATLARYLQPLIREFAHWRNEEQWLRALCPTCGAAPSMAQLETRETVSIRLFSCAYCKSRWQFRRTGCAFCSNEDDHQITALAVEGEAGLRIDYCELCGGYLKTYRSERGEAFFLAEWATLHLDILARDRGLKHLAASLYQL